MSSEPQYDYDIIVIGAGSGGLACAKEAAPLGAKTLLFDAVVPTPQGTHWGLGGTCVNVGCIPKKLFHRAAQIGHDINDAPAYGYKDITPGPHKIDWPALVQDVQNHVLRTNFLYRNALRLKDVNFLRFMARFKDSHTITYQKKDETVEVTGKNIVIAVGARPQYPDIPGAKEYCITSDDLFSRKQEPGKTLCIGASYVSLECAGFITELGYDVTVMVRSVLLRGFDREISEKIGAFMEKSGTKFLKGFVPVEISKGDDGKIIAKYQSVSGGAIKEDIFDTVLIATGRIPATKYLNLQSAGVVYDEKTGKVPVVDDRTNVPHIYCIGDAQKDAPELTPTAILAGKLLARRLFKAGEIEVARYDIVPTTVFTPLEYGVIGLSEEAAYAKYGGAEGENVRVYVSEFGVLEWQIVNPQGGRTNDNMCLVKIIVDNRAGQNERVIGLHYLGPDASQVITGYGPAFRLGVTKKDLDLVVGVHPSQSEEVHLTHIWKGSGESAEKVGCCG